MYPNNNPMTETNQTGEAVFSGAEHHSGYPVGVTPAPAPDTTVPDRLRTAYAEASDLPYPELLVEWAPKALSLRAARAHQAEVAAYAAAHDGRILVTRDRPSYDAVLRGGIQPEDMEHAQHLHRLDVAERAVSAAESAAVQATARENARCRACGAVDIPTRTPVVTLTVDAPPVGYIAGPSGSVLTLDGGPVCSRCEVAIGAQYRAAIVDEVVGKRRSRADAARDYLRQAQTR